MRSGIFITDPAPPSPHNLVLTGVLSNFPIHTSELDSAGNYYVAGTAASMIALNNFCKISPSGHATSSEIADPSGALDILTSNIDPGDNIYLAGPIALTHTPDTGYIYKVTSGGIVTNYTTFSPSQYYLLSSRRDASGNIYTGGWKADATPFTPFVFKTPLGGGTSTLYATSGLPTSVLLLIIEIDPSGNLFVFLQLPSPTGLIVYKVPPGGGAATSYLSGGPIPPISFHPTDTKSDSSGNLYVVGYNGTNAPLVYKILVGGSFSSYVSGGLPANFQIQACQFDLAGNLYVAGFNASTGAPLVYKIPSGGGVATNYIPSGLPAFFEITTMQISSTGTLYMAGNGTAGVSLAYKF